MSSTKKKIFAAALGAVFMDPLFAAPQKCPLTVDTTQAIKSAPVGWTVLSASAPSRLTRVALFDGPPAEMASLKPDNGDTDEAPVWTLSPNNPEGYWLVCYYDDTNVALAKRMSGKVSSCRGILDRFSAIQDVDCRP